MIKPIGSFEDLVLFSDGTQAVTISIRSFDVSPSRPLKEMEKLHQWGPISGTLPEVYTELASSSFLVNTVSNQTNRTYRVPKAVLTELQASLPDEPALLASARTLLTGTINTDSVKALQANYKNLPSPAAVSWVSRIVQSLVAAGELDAPLEPHVFELNPDDSDFCKICGLPLEDTIHIPPSEDAEGSNKFFALFNAEDRVDALIAQDSAGAFWQRDLGVWTPTEAPEDRANLVLLDTDSVLSLRSQIDEASNLPGTYELSISEERLAELALPEMDLDLYARVFQTLPYVSPEVRSENASRQSRDSEGKFIKMGARLTTPRGEAARVTNLNPGEDTVTVTTDAGQEEQVNASEIQVENPEPKAVLLQRPNPVEDLAGLLEEYLQAGKPSSEFAIVVGEGEESPAASSSGGGSVLLMDGGTTDSSPGTSTENSAADIEPLYLAVVDHDDLQAVLELISIIPSEDGTGLEAYSREDTTWVPAPDLLADLQGTTPPPVVELDESTLDDVINQIDGKAMQASAAPQTAEVVCYTLTRDADGILTAVQGTTPILASYSTTGEFPLDVYESLDELFAQADNLDRNQGNAERLRRYWTVGPGGAKINWANDDGNWTRCVRQLTKYLGPGARGYCQILHKQMTGHYTGSERKE